MRKALFAGSFDPVTIGHLEIVKRGLALFDQVIVAIGTNNTKKYMFSMEERLAMLQASFADEDRVLVTRYDTLTVDFAKAKGAGCLLRGIRNGSDLNYEKPIATINKYLNAEVETVYLAAEGRFADISSTLVREVIRYGRNPKGLVPDAALQIVSQKQK